MVRRSRRRGSAASISALRLPPSEKGGPVSQGPNPYPHFNASCGTDDDGMPAIILVQYDDTTSLDKGQSVRILGTVQEPTEGVNGFGGEATYATDKAEFME